MWSYQIVPLFGSIKSDTGASRRPPARPPAMPTTRAPHAMSTLPLLASAGAVLLASGVAVEAQSQCGPALPDTDFIGDNKFELPDAANWTACCAACASIKPCHFWTFEGASTHSGACFLKAASSTPAGHQRMGRVSGRALGAHGAGGWPSHPHPPPSPPWIPPGPYRCASALDCSLNGACTSRVNLTTNSSCACGAGWIGKRCETLDLQPAREMSGYRMRDDGHNTSSWGAPVVRDGSGWYHMWPAEMTHHCGSELLHISCLCPVCCLCLLLPPVAAASLNGVLLRAATRPLLSSQLVGAQLSHRPRSLHGRWQRWRGPTGALRSPRGGVARLRVRAGRGTRTHWRSGHVVQHEPQ
jgi:hypothetical protein